MKKYLCKYNMTFLNFISLLLLLLCMVITYFFYKLGFLNFFCDTILNTMDDIYVQKGGHFSFLFDFFVLFGYLILHELVHGITYQMMGAKGKNIKYGIALEKGILFTKCGEEVDKKTILVSIIAPFLILGVFTYILSIFLRSSLLLILSIFNISGCSGDISLFFFFLKRDKSMKFREIDDSSTFILESQEDLLNRKFLSVNVVKEVVGEVKDSKYLKKINISKVSAWCLFFIGILFIILLLLF